VRPALVVGPPGTRRRRKTASRTMPGYDRYVKMTKEFSGGTYKSGAVAGPRGKGGGKGVHLREGPGKTVPVRPRTQKIGEARPSGPTRRRRAGRMGKGRGAAAVRARPPSRAQSFAFGRRLVSRPFLPATATCGCRTPRALLEMPITTDGNEKLRNQERVGGVWVYGEGTRPRNDAMWWSPDGKAPRLLPLRRRAACPGLPAWRSTRPGPHDQARRRAITRKAGRAETRSSSCSCTRVGGPRRRRRWTFRRRQGNSATTVVGHYAYHVSWSPGREGKLHFKPDETRRQKYHGVRRRRTPEHRQGAGWYRSRGVAAELGRELAARSPI